MFIVALLKISDALQH